MQRVQPLERVDFGRAGVVLGVPDYETLRVMADAGEPVTLTFFAGFRAESALVVSHGRDRGVRQDETISEEVWFEAEGTGEWVERLLRDIQPGPVGEDGSWSFSAMHHYKWLHYHHHDHPQINSADSHAQLTRYEIQVSKEGFAWYRVASVESTCLFLS